MFSLSTKLAAQLEGAQMGCFLIPGFHCMHPVSSCGLCLASLFCALGTHGIDIASQKLALCPGLKHVGFEKFPNDDVASISPVLSRTLCGLEKLVRLAIRTPIDGVALRHVVMLPQVAEHVLRIRNSQIEDLSLLPSETPFSGTKDIALIGPDLGSMASLLRSEGQAFSGTEFCFEAPPTSQLTLSLLTSLASPPRRSSLQSITLDWEDSLTPDSKFRDNLYVISHDTLRPLAFFHSLRELSVDLINVTSLDDEELVDLAHGWPLLRFLRLVSWNGPQTKHLTLQGLISLVAICPKLERIDLSLDASAVPASQLDWVCMFVVRL